jgi:hypothetical protein
MSKPRWALRLGKWGPVKPDFWRIWHANKESLQKNGYSVRKNENGQWETRYIPPGWPPVKPYAVFVPTGMKASICFKCGHVKLIQTNEDTRTAQCAVGRSIPIERHATLDAMENVKKIFA